MQNPFPFYQYLRENAPVHYDPVLKAWLVSRYDDIRSVLLDADTYSMELGWKLNYAHGFADEFQAILERDGGGFFPDVIMTDPPLHTRIRGLMDKAFTPHRIRALEPGITARVVGFIERFPGSGEFDGTRDFALPLTVDILCEQLGMTDVDYATIERWSLAISAQVGRVQTREEMEQNAAQICELQRFVIDLIEQRRGNPGNDLISDLVHARSEDDENPALDFRELVACTRALLVGGNETTSSAIGNMLLILATRPEVRSWLAENADSDQQVARFVEEVMRIAPATRALSRVTTREVELAGQHLPKHAQVMIMFASGNHDQAHFPAPELVDTKRANLGSHLAFGAGIHRCVGMALARMEMKVVARELVTRLRELELAVPLADIRYLPSVSNHTIVNLPLRYARSGN
ncbi:cytochrome P450 [Haliea sp. E17]|uniref:cytochrome P450 n=1 Tax=Haliea sp. E17 TaxID=3401576 RepID=UPI003AB0725A